MYFCGLFKNYMEVNNSIFKEFWNIIRYFLFWYLIALVDRSIFLLSFLDKLEGNKLQVAVETFCYGLRLDLSFAAYISIIPFLVYCIAYYFPRLGLGFRFYRNYTLVMLVILSFITIININIYREWGDKISNRAIDAFLISPSGAVASAESTPMAIPILVFIGSLMGEFFLYLRVAKSFAPAHARRKLFAFGRFLIYAVFLFTCIRSGYGRAALNPSMAYFSEVNFHNHAAVNTYWALMKDYFKPKQTNPYPFFSDEEANKLLAPVFYEEPGKSPAILNTQRPNVVLIILESYIADLVASLGGEPGITPKMEELIKQGVLFNNVYAASDRSDKGMVGILSAFPAQGPESIIKHITKHENLPAMGQELDSLGYQNSFYYGGQSEFYNFKSYMLSHGVERIVDNSDFNFNHQRSSWGVYDHEVFKRMISDLDQDKEPFFSTMFTLINHEPFELKGTYKFGNKNNADKFRSTAYYTDSALFAFIEEAKTKDWYKNTLFIMVADHGHRLPAEKWDLSHPQRFHIPLLFFGDVIKPEYRGEVITRLGNQTDMVGTLFQQMGVSRARYPWSRDLLNPSVPAYAFYNSKDALGIISPEQTLSYDNVGQIINYRKNSDANSDADRALLDTAKAYYQNVYKQFLSY